MKDHYRPKSLDQALGYLVEECGEVLAAVGKTQRWGPGSSNPELGPGGETNRQWIRRELLDLENAIAIARVWLLREETNAPGSPQQGGAKP